MEQCCVSLFVLAADVTGTTTFCHFPFRGPPKAAGADVSPPWRQSELMRKLDKFQPARLRSPPPEPLRVASMSPSKGLLPSAAPQTDRSAGDRSEAGRMLIATARAVIVVVAAAAADKWPTSGRQVPAHGQSLLASRSRIRFISRR